MTFASLAIFSTLAARFVAAQAPERCSLMGNVSLIRGTTSDTASTATPIGWSTSATAPTDANSHGLLAVRSTISPTLWGAWACGGAPPTGGGGGGGGPVGGGGGGVVNLHANGGTTSGPPGGGGGGNGNGSGGGGSGVGASTSLFNMFGTNADNYNPSAIAENSTNLCLTASSLNLANTTITRASCINPLTDTPFFTQAWQWTVEEFNGTMLPVVDSLVFMGTQSITTLTVGTPTNYVPTLVGSGVGAYVALDWLPGELDPADVASTPGLLVSFVG
ncbi:hypothetical protein B0H10DRAFT_2338486 [Mycena sp. CBHHK59/15]|nr:hypothetical protein B0H10DRAFT_2359304 [Mycena sp. CBHHK59/15]KAJ6583820.1 hypothetical protein B0H10DRAFT_2338486 [Mycena sp. CBHHK59/15]